MTNQIFSQTQAEFSLIDWIAGQQLRHRAEVKLGIGDDAAILSAPGFEWVVTTDVITQGVHFTAETAPELIGRKALAVNLSDLAAMAATPCAAFIGIVLPRTYGRQSVEQLYHGLLEIAEEFDVTIAGGDTNSWDGPLIISVTLHGLVAPDSAVRRHGARPGDWIFVTGALGGSFDSQRHLKFVPRVKEAIALRKTVNIHAMLDLSDGLGSDLFHLLNQSRVGAILEASDIPIHADVTQGLSEEERIRHALGDGEDFELLFCVSPEAGKRLQEFSPVAVSLTKIGEITLQPAACLRYRDNIQALTRSGWSHSFSAIP